MLLPNPDEVELPGTPTVKKPPAVPGATAPVSAPFSAGKAQGGEGPASTNTSVDGIQPMTSNPSTAQPPSEVPQVPTAPTIGDPVDANAIPVPPLPTAPPVSEVPPLPIPQIGEIAFETPNQHPGSNAPDPVIGVADTRTPEQVWADAQRDATGTVGAKIDPTNDLRSSVILPEDDPALTSALTGTQNATTALDSFDRRKLVEELMGKNAGPDVPDIAPEDDLRAKVISDDEDKRTTDYAGAVDKAAANLPTDITGRSNTLRDDYLAKAGNTDVATGPDISMAASDRLNKYGTMLDQSVNGLNGVDRNKMAMELYQQFQDREAPNRAAAERKAKQFAAATGGLRSGKLRTSIGDLELANKREDNLTQRQLITQALNDSIGDQYNKADFLRGTEGDLANRETGMRNELRTDRNFKTDVATGNVGRRLSTLGTATDAGRTGAAAEADNAKSNLGILSGLESGARDANRLKIAGKRTERANQMDLTDRKRSIFESNRSNANNQADAASNDIARRVDANRSLFGDVANETRARRSEVRGERGYQGDLEDSAFRRRLAQYEAETGATQQNFQNGISQLAAGESGNPSQVMTQLAQQFGMDPSVLMALAQQMGQGGSKPSGSGGLDFGGISDLLKLLPRKTGVDTPPNSGTLPA